MTLLRVRLRDSFITLTIPDGWDTWTCQGTLFRRRYEGSSKGQVIEYRTLTGSWRAVQVLEIAA